MFALIIILIIIALLIFAIISGYNSLQNLKTNIDEAESQIDVQLQRRADLIPNLVATVKGYADFESKTLREVISARNGLISGENLEEKMEANEKLNNQLSHMFAVAENYPDLKANQGFTSLQEELTNTENKIGYSRQLYNSCVGTYNRAILNFPKNIIANVFHFEKANYLKVEQDAKKPVKVQF